MHRLGRFLVRLNCVQGPASSFRNSHMYRFHRLFQARRQIRKLLSCHLLYHSAIFQAALLVQIPKYLEDTHSR